MNVSAKVGIFIWNCGTKMKNDRKVQKMHVLKPFIEEFWTTTIGWEQKISWSTRGVDLGLWKNEIWKLSVDGEKWAWNMKHQRFAMIGKKMKNEWNMREL